MSTVSEPIASKEDAHPMSPPLSPAKESDSVNDEKPSSIKQDTAKRNSGETESNMSETLAAHTESISDKRNHEFHTLFKSIPEDDNLVEDYGCALQKEILVQGRLYISEAHLCFNANIFGWVTNFVIAFSDIVEVEKRTTAIFIPNAINITTSDHSNYLFASFLSRDQAYDLIMDVWRYAQSVASESSSGMESDDEGEEEDDDVTSFEEEDSNGEDTEVEMKKSVPAPPTTSKQPTAPKAPAPASAPAAKKSSKQVKEKTECVCAGDHYPNTVLDEVYDV
ncbi:hypothetical protein [Absidia glauca]|uniref:GRAM domain-containing protein n=1 Tax=Absidia glauca TaxID=4829 RepID=A0A168KUD3_ABSGL|nr:hypothetical protein [Absidia glauca]